MHWSIDISIIVIEFMPEDARVSSSAAVSIPASSYEMARYDRSVEKSSGQIAKNTANPNIVMIIGTNMLKSIHLKLPLSLGFHPMRLKSAFAKSAATIGANMQIARLPRKINVPVIPPMLLPISAPAI